MKKFLMSALVLGTMNSALYAGSGCASTNCYNVQVDRLYMTANGTLYVGTSGDEKALDCAAGAGNGGVENKYMSLRSSDEGQKAMYSLLLTAKTTKLPVTIRVSTGTTDCRIAYIATN